MSAATHYDENLEYFIGVCLPEPENRFLTKLKQELSKRQQLSAPPHITLVIPFKHNSEKKLVKQLTNWAATQSSFKAEFKKIDSFSHQETGAVFLQPEEPLAFTALENSLTDSIRFLPKTTNFQPHLTLAQRVPLLEISSVKNQISALDLSLKLQVNRVTLFSRVKPSPWTILKNFELKPDNSQT